jgi:type VI secretion system protein ImpA
MNTWLNAHKKLLDPIDPIQPCGSNIEYDPAFILLFASVEPKTEAQYGDFTSEAETVNWGEVSKDAEILLLRSKDIRLLIIWLRAQVNINGAQGLATGLSLLRELLSQYPQELHPSMEVDGEKDEFYRANALSALLEITGLLNEIRQIYLSKNNAFRLQVRDIERAMAAPRPSDALPISNVVQQLNALYDTQSKELKALEDSSRLSKEIEILANQQLPEFSPNFEPLIKLLSWFDTETPIILQKNGLYRPNLNAAQLTEQAIKTNESNSIEQQVLENKTALGNIRTYDAQDGRAEAQALIRQARLWFATNEPSSPVVLLLQQAEGLIGKPFEQVFQAIPVELVEKWQANEILMAKPDRD